MRVQGYVEPGFEVVKAAFSENFERRGEIGAALVVRRHGQVVVDLYGGLADPRTRRPWEAQTPGVLFSVTKGLVAMVLLRLTEQGVFDPDAPLSEVWPELRAKCTGRMLLNHRAGLSAIDAPLELQDFGGRPSERARQAMQDQVPLWEPDTDQGYGACAFGVFTSELIYRLTGRTVGAIFAEEIAAPLGLRTWIGLPLERFPEVARLIPTPTSERLRFQVPSALSRRTPEGRLFRRIAAQSRSIAGRAFLNPSLGPAQFDALNDPTHLARELPWIGGVSTADSLSKAYSALLGEIDGVRLVQPKTLRPLRHRQSWSPRDRVLHKPLGFAQGFVKEETRLFSPNPASFGHPGAGGALGWADPDAGLSVGYVMNRMDWRIRSPRALALCHAVYKSL